MTGRVFLGWGAPEREEDIQLERVAQEEEDEELIRLAVIGKA